MYFCNSGGEANDFAMMMARLHTKATKFFSLRNAYHGLVGNAASVTNVGTWNHGYVRGHDIEKFAYPSSYRGTQKSPEGYLEDAKEALHSLGGGPIAGFIAEPVMGVGGVVPLNKNYLEEVYKLVKANGGLTISDEVQTGFGRIGKSFWGYKWLGVKPDIVTMAKGIGNGFPMAAVATRREIGDAIKKNFFNTFGGGPMQCVIGIEVLNILRDEKLPENSEKMGQHLRSRLLEIQKKSRVVGDVRGQGLMNAIEIVKNKETKEPGTQEAADLMELTREQGILLSKGGPLGNVFRILPALCVTQEDIDYACDRLEDILTKM